MMTLGRKPRTSTQYPLSAWPTPVRDAASRFEPCNPFGDLQRMGRLIEVQDVATVPSRLTVNVGDVLWFYATGGRLTGSQRRADASQVLEVLRPLASSVLAPSGSIVTPV